MQRRWLVALALAAGCGGAVVPAPTGDGSADHVPSGDAVGEARPDAHLDAAAERAEVANVDAHADADRPAEVRPDALPTYCPTTIPAVTLASSPVTGVLQGASNNPAVSCRGGVPTQGPEAYFTLTLAAPVTLEVVVSAPVDTLIAIRTGACADGISEITCSEDAPLPDPGDGGADAAPPEAGSTPSNLRQTGLRTPLAAGTYTIVVDTFTLGNLATVPFTMTLSQIAPLPNASCTAPTLLTSGSTTTGQALDRAGASATICGGNAESALFFAVGVPAGQRLTARATPETNMGDRAWMPRMQAFTTCAATTCLAQGHLAAGSGQQVDWVNNGSTWQLVYLAVAADGPVAGAVFDLAVTVVDLFATCNRPVVVQDGTMLTGQDLGLGAPPTGQTCGGASDHAFYYAATLLPQQQISVVTTASLGTNTFQTVTNANIRTDCQTLSCVGNGSSADFTNQTTSDETVIIEVTPIQQGLTGLFDLAVSMPPPPAAILVTPTSGLVTSESGTTATFTVALQSPPTAPVTIALASDTPTEGTASPASLVFNATNWRTPQTVTVKGVDDQVADGPRDYTIVTSAAVSDDPSYSGLDPDDVSATNLDNDPGVTFSGADNVVTTEAGGKSTFKVALNTAPTADVTLPLSTSDSGEGTVSPAQLKFTTANWSVPQTVTVTGVDDAIVDGTQTYSIVTGALVSTDARYGGQNPPDVTAHNLDDDQVPVGVKLVSGNHSCSQSTIPMAVDGAGRIYIVMSCEVGLWLATSSDGGVTFGDPTMITGTEPSVGGATVFIAGGSAGFAYLAFPTNQGSLAFTRTTDGGATWSTPVLQVLQPNIVRLVGAGKTVLILTPDPNGPNTLLSRSLDGGRSFLTPETLSGSNLDLSLEPDGQTAWLLALDGTGTLSKSTDAGATFAQVDTQTVDTQFHLLGNDHLFSFPGELQITTFEDPTSTAASVSFISLPPLAMAVDDVDTITILDTEPQAGRLRATHVILGAPAPTDGTIIGPNAGLAGIVTLSRKASAIAFANGSVVLFTTVVWP